MSKLIFFDFISQFGEYQTRSMFGGTGVFQQDAMFALLTQNSIFIRGNKRLNYQLTQLGCERFRHIKKQTTAVVNYYDITTLFEQANPKLNQLVRCAINYAIEQKNQQRTQTCRRLRDLPNMQLTLERMVRKSGINDVETFLKLGAAEVFSKVRNTYGNNVDISLLWKFAGAIEGIHWKLLQEPKKRELLEYCQS